MPKMTVSFRSEWNSIAGQLFDRAFVFTRGDIFSSEDLGDLPPHMSDTGGQLHYMFDNDTLLRDVRSWGAYALACGLITSFNVVVE